MKILVPVDGSERALDAVRHALRLKREGLNATFVLATVQEPTYLYELMLAPDADVLERVSGAVGSRALEGAEALFNAAGVSFEREIGSGDPAQTLVELAERLACDAIILGSRGLGTLRGALFGSVSQAVLHAAKVPVTIIRHTESDAAD
ncbi:MAG: universal stress protein [Hydrogenophaga sp.]|uniref:universal stress protein n=1 Tax=unclassified Hydrogenophaga TaxID=2610897 RepID=UPI0010F8551B|nr:MULTISPECIES: universal stress protein [unclassified Hydrogenophaga]MDP3251571.1 universal stress protein [Hydrogenophaga sp.]MDP3811646.1 universal stress protein [Hydrogenophaga sp.]MDZ4100148.1 universal stress protein [Hydrogenophaga sp.]